jgi:hypothetical protein
MRQNVSALHGTDEKSKQNVSRKRLYRRDHLVDRDIDGGDNMKMDLKEIICEDAN